MTRDTTERGRPLAPSSTTRTTRKKRDHKISALQKRTIREKLEREIKNVIATPPSERTSDESKLLSVHGKAKVRSLLKQMEKSAQRKRSMEENAEEREDSKREIDDAVAVVMKLLREDAGAQFVLHTGAGVSTSAKIPGTYLIGWFSIERTMKRYDPLHMRFKFGRLSFSFSVTLFNSLCV